MFYLMSLLCDLFIFTQREYSHILFTLISVITVYICSGVIVAFFIYTNFRRKQRKRRSNKIREDDLEQEKGMKKIIILGHRDQQDSLLLPFSSLYWKRYSSYPFLLFIFSFLSCMEKFVQALKLFTSKTTTYTFSVNPFRSIIMVESQEKFLSVSPSS